MTGGILDRERYEITKLLTVVVGMFMEANIVVVVHWVRVEGQD